MSDTRFARIQDLPSSHLLGGGTLNPLSAGPVLYESVQGIPSELGFSRRASPHPLARFLV